MKKIIALLLVLILGVTMLAACGGGGDDGKEPTIVGTWKDETFGLEITYKEDGTFENFGVTKKYTFEDGILTQYGDAFDTVFEVVFEDSNTIVLTQIDPYPLVPVTYTRKK